MVEWWSEILASLGWLSDINCQHSFFTHNRETDTQGGIDPSKRGACLDQFEFCRYQESLPVCPNFATIPRGRAGKAGTGSVPRVPRPSLLKQLPQRRHRHDTIQCNGRCYTFRRNIQSRQNLPLCSHYSVALRTSRRKVEVIRRCRGAGQAFTSKTLHSCQTWPSIDRRRWSI